MSIWSSVACIDKALDHTYTFGEVDVATATAWNDRIRLILDDSKDPQGEIRCFEYEITVEDAVHLIEALDYAVRKVRLDWFNAL